MKSITFSFEKGKKAKILIDGEEVRKETEVKKILEYFNNQYCQGKCCNQASMHIYINPQNNDQFLFDYDGFAGIPIKYCCWCSKELNKEIFRLNEVM